jgi:hypothetical protein
MALLVMQSAPATEAFLCSSGCMEHYFKQIPRGAADSAYSSSIPAAGIEPLPLNFLDYKIESIG